jgi:hypothetical protein
VLVAAAPQPDAKNENVAVMTRLRIMLSDSHAPSDRPSLVRQLAHAI